MRNKTSHMKAVGWAAVLAVACVLAGTSLAGQPKQWTDVPAPVRATVLANGGSEGTVDLENGKIKGKAVYEAQGKDKAGNAVDLVVTEDGKLVEMKNDAAADKAQEEAAARAKQFAKAMPKFSHPRDITNPYLPLGSLKQDILEGKEGGKSLRIERTLKPGKQTVESLAMEDREFENGKLSEITLDYFAQADDGAVYYLGEDVDVYKDGKVAGHEGAWLLGKQAKVPGMMMPGNPQVGDKFRAEDVAPITTEDCEVISFTDSVTVPAGTYQNCLRVKEVLSDGGTEYKYYAKGVGCIQELPDGGDVRLMSHTAGNR
jgi:hypothetical protein